VCHYEPTWDKRPKAMWRHGRWAILCLKLSAKDLRWLKDTRHFPIREWADFHTMSAIREFFYYVLPGPKPANSRETGQCVRKSPKSHGFRDPILVMGVSSKPLSHCISLSTGNLTRKSRGFRGSFRMAPRGMLHNSLPLCHHDGPSRLKKNREFS
jgi:hypothetical protein